MSTPLSRHNDSAIAAMLHDPERESGLLEGVARRVLERARAGGASQAEASVVSSLGRDVSVRMGEIESLEEARDRTLQISVYRGQCTGSASTGDLRPEAIDECVDRALAIARYTQADRAAGLADAELMASDFPDLDLWHAEDRSLDELVERAMRVESAARDADKRVVNSEGASVSSEATIGVYANSHGFVGRMRGTSCSQSCAVIARDDSGMQRDYDYDMARRFAALAAPEQTGAEAARRTVRRLGAEHVKTGQMPILFAPEVARGLLRHLLAAVSGGNLYRRSSFLLDTLGEQLLPQWVTLIERPRLPQGARSAVFDADGVATREAPLIRDGVLERYVLSSYSARRLGLETTANAGGVRNLELVGASQDFGQLLASMDRGLLITELMGQGVNLVTGDYSRGAAGFRVERGQIAAPVEEFTIAGNLRDMFANLVAAGTDVDTRHSMRVGSLLLDKMVVAGQ